MKAYVDPEKCISCGFCVGMCNSVFAFNDNHVAEVVGEITEDIEEMVEATAENCPVNAIEVEQ